MATSKTLRRYFFYGLTIGILAMGVNRVDGVQSDESKWTKADLDFFEKKIRPVLVDKCYSCHSDQATSVAASLRVDSREGLLRGGDSGPAIEPGNPDDSLLMLAINYEDEDIAMPPKKEGGKLPDEVIADFKKWIQRDAADPRKESKIIPDSGAGESAKSWWAFQPLTQPVFPTPANGSWSDQAIDRFVMQGLENHQLAPVADAAPATLLRRVYFDLTGLPPKPEEAKSFVEAWEKAASPQEQTSLYEKVVDRLLESPQYGEHWGRHWMDVARFAESSGKDFNALYPHAWRYRDYIVDAFNSDMPYSQFVREQIAGDLLPSNSDRDKARQITATGFLAVGAKSINEQNGKQLVVDIADEQIDAVSQGFLGITIACARCHDHKFDPISQVDYTAMSGIFLSTETHYGTTGGVGGRNGGSLAKLPYDGNEQAVRSISKEEVDRRKQQLKDLEAERAELIAQRFKDRRKGVEQDNNDILRITNQIAGLKTRLANYSDSGKPIAQAMGVSDKPVTAPPMNRSMSNRFNMRRGGSAFVSIGDSPLYVRGEIDRPSDKVKRALPDLFENVKVPSIPAGTSGRKELATWVTDPKNPLASRVMVNRIWHWLFGAGIVTSVDNFGTTGAEPTHPELLDYLSNRFIENQWSVKKMIREIVMTRTYRLASTYDENSFKADPVNAYLWRHNPKRLEAEAIRDSILMASNQLNLTRPVGSLIAANGDGVLGGPRRMGVSEESVLSAVSDHRSIYLPLTRGVEPEILGIFDFPDAAAVQGARQTTNVPGQALYMLNSDFVEQQARRVATRLGGRDAKTRTLGNVRKTPVADPKKFEELFEELCWLTYSRPATTKETAAAKKLYLEHREDPLKGATSVIRAMLASAEFRSID